MSDKITVQFLPAVASACGPGNACACGPGDEASMVDPNEVLEQRVSQLREHFGDRLEIRVADYSSSEDVADVITTLNAALQKSGAAFTVSQASLPTFLETVAPIITVGDEVAFSRGVPPFERLREKVEEQLAGASA